MSSESFSTAPPKDTGLVALKVRAVHAVSALIMPVVSKAARNHFAGESLEEALRVAEKWGAGRYSSTIGYWDKEDCTSREVADHYIAAIKRAATKNLDIYISIKPPALHYNLSLADDLAAVANATRMRLHFDSHGTDTVDRSNAMLDAMAQTMGYEKLSTTLPGRWKRSLTDIDWAIGRQLRVRVVKGQWPDPKDYTRDPRKGFLQLIDQLAGRVPHIGIATHDMALAKEALAKLRTTATSFELEQILGLTSDRFLKWAHENGIPVRIYVPFGKGYLPNAVGVMKRNPRLALKVIQNLFSAS